MYLIELIVKKFFSKNNGFIKQKTEEQLEEERCEHVFMPVDSTGEILACNKCGAVVHKKALRRYKGPEGHT